MRAKSKFRSVNPVNRKSPSIILRLLVLCLAILAVADAQNTDFPTLKKAFEQKKGEIDQLRDNRRGAMLKRYAEIALNLKNQYQTAGKLDAAVASTKEIEASKKGEFVFSPDLETDFPPELQSARKVAAAEIRRIERQYGQEMLQLTQRYVQTLNTLKKSLVQKGELQEGIAVDEEIKSMASIVERLREGRGMTNIKRPLPPELKKDLILFFPFDEEGKDFVEDLSESGYKGVLEGTTYVPNGKSAGARSFNGMRDRIAISGPLPDSTEVTVSVWINFQGDEMTGGIFSDFDGRTGNDLMLCLVGDERLHIRADKSGGRLRTQVRLRKSVKNAWHHLVWVMDEDDSTVYLDGRRVERVEARGTNVGFHRAFIGFANNETNWAYFKGEIDELMVWKRALTGNQVDTVYGLVTD